MKQKGTFFLRSILRDIALRIMSSISTPQPGIHIISLHATGLNYTTENKQIVYEEFCDFLSFLRKYCEFIRIEDSVKQILNKTITADRLISFTFDDGFKECYTIVAPALEEFNTNAAFFINCGFINGDEAYRKRFTSDIIESPGKLPINWDEVIDLSRRKHIIGSHTLDHVNLNCKDLNLIDFQISENKRLIEKHLKQSCDFFAFPYGQYHHISLEALQIAEKYHKYIFGSFNYKNYYSFNNRILNRRHIESWWPKSHIKYFLSASKKY